MRLTAEAVEDIVPGLPLFMIIKLNQDPALCRMSWSILTCFSVIPDLLKENGAKTIIDVACGTGVDSVMLCEAGFHMWSVDASDKVCTSTLWALCSEFTSLPIAKIFSMHSLRLSWLLIISADIAKVVMQR